MDEDSKEPMDSIHDESAEELTDDDDDDDGDFEAELDESLDGGEDSTKPKSKERDQDRLYDQPSRELTEQELDEIADTTIEAIREILFFFDAEESDIEEYEGDEGELIFDIVGDNLAMLIGRHGRTLESLQYLVSAIVNKRIGFHYPVVVDIEGYLNRRRQKLVALAKSSAARAIRQKKSVRLRPMSPYERRIIHMALKSDRRVKTESEGQEPNRQVVIHFTK